MSRKIYLGLITLCFAITFFAVFPADATAQNRRQRRRARNLVAQGDVLYRRRQYEDAISKYSEALSILPKFPHARFSKGYSHFNLKQYGLAVNDFGLALDVGYKPQVDVYSVRWEAHFLNKDLDSALKDIKRGQQLASSNGEFYIAEGRVYHEKRNYSGAIDSFERAMNMGSKNRDLQFYLANSYYAVGRYADQKNAAEIALRSGTRFPGWAWFFIGDSLQREYKHKEAVRAYTTSMATNPDIYNTYANLSDAYRNLNQFVKAVDIAKAGAEKYPNSVDLLVSLSWYYSLANRNPLAIYSAKKAIELSPNQYMAHTNLCRAYNDEKKYNFALQSCKKALKLQPGDGETNFYLGRTYQLMGNTRLSRSSYKKAVIGLKVFTKNNPDYSDGFYLLGNAYFADGQRENAIAAYKDCLEISPLFARARYNLGYVYTQKGNNIAAREQYDALQQIDTSLAGKLLAVIENK